MGSGNNYFTTIIFYSLLGTIKVNTWSHNKGGRYCVRCTQLSTQGGRGVNMNDSLLGQQCQKTTKRFNY